MIIHDIKGDGLPLTREKITTSAIIELLKEMMVKDQNSSFMMRAAHTKNLGLLKGYFTVCPDLPEHLRIGLFREPKSYPAFLRFSNSNPKFTSDKLKDIRGIAIKLIDDTQSNFSQDFILASCPTLPFGTLTEFNEVLYWGLKNPFYLLIKMLVQGNLAKFIQIYKMTKHDPSPLDIKYWSITPYAFGDRVVKYILLPTSTYHSTLPQDLTDSYLSTNMQRHLLTNDATFDFCIQLQKDKTKMPIDDVSIQWNETESTPIKVAEIRILAQNFNTKERAYLSESLTYSPENCLAEHKPLGTINQARIEIYNELSTFHCTKNQIPKIMPTESKFNSI